MIPAVSRIVTRKIIIALAIILLSSLSIYDGISILMLHKSNSRIQKDDHEILLSQTLINELIQKIANQEYLKDVSDSRLKWLLSHTQNHHRGISFQAAVATQPSQPITQATPKLKSVSRKSVPSNQQCLYQNKIYSIGAIIQTDKGWARCTIGWQLNDNNSTQSLKAVWTLQDTLL